ncbi:MAG: alpha-L-fucosidase [Kiritimatiellae bacterium]|nr:alpha-L-fucosidase [Kiritimatiellia bacterium]
MRKALFVVCALAACCAVADYQPSWESLNSRPCPQWWKDAKFGIFIHWGIYAVPAYAPTGGDGIYNKYSEHYWNRLRHQNKDFVEHHKKYYPGKSYQDFATEFTCEYFDPVKWASVLKKSGAKYVVLTSKHHEGFSLWPSKTNPRWNAVALGPHRDLLGDLTKAVKDAGLRMGYYYSLLEWNNPLYTKETIERYVQEVNIPQLKELVLNYRPDIVWTDGEWDFTYDKLHSIDFLTWLYNESPVKDSVVTNDRWGKGIRGKCGDHYTTEYDQMDGDTKGTRFSHPWEECRGIGGSFGFNQFEEPHDYMTAAQCVEMLVEKVARGGNLLLNIGPQANGLIPVIMQERLLQMGSWLAVNGEAIYETTQWEKHPGAKEMRASHVYYTRKPNALYVICCAWPQAPLRIPNAGKGKGVSLLGSTLPVRYEQTDDGTITITPPSVNPGNMPCEYAWTFKINLAE